jgi:uncharacterized membrane protein YhaH (DUF805 family)
VLEAYKHYADFHGRAGRSEYWLFILLNFLVMVGAVLLGAVAGAVAGEDIGVTVGVGAYLIFALASFIPSLAVIFRRLHDTDRSAWWYLISLVPFGSIVLIVFFCLPGTPGPNRYGAPPLGDLRTTFA